MTSSSSEGDDIEQSRGATSDSRPFGPAHEAGGSPVLCSLTVATKLDHDSTVVPAKVLFEI
jgi:hypothetical protein